MAQSLLVFFRNYLAIIKMTVLDIFNSVRDHVKSAKIGSISRASPKTDGKALRHPDEEMAKVILRNTQAAIRSLPDDKIQMVHPSCRI
jgi:hypothetical protein